MAVSTHATSIVGYLLIGIILFICNLVLLLRVFLKNRKKFSDAPLDDSTWNIEKNELYQELQKTINNINGQICGVLNIQSALDFVKIGVADEGFCIMTDKSYYFINKVRTKKDSYITKAKAQKEINSNEMKTVEVEKLARFDSLISWLLSVFLTIANIGWFSSFLSVIAQFELHANEIPFMIQIITIIAVICIIVTLIILVYCFISTFIAKKTYVCIKFAKKSIAFPISLLGVQEIADFRKVTSELHNS